MVALLEMKVDTTENNRTFRILSQTLPSNVIVPGTGHGGGMWICWDPQAIRANLIHASDQHVTLSHTFSDNPTAVGQFIVVYASPD